MWFTNFFAQIPNDRKKQVLFTMVTMCILIIVWVGSLVSIRSMREKQKVIEMNTYEDYSILTELNEPKIEKGKVLISGSVVRLKSTLSDMRIVLKESSSSDIELIDTFVSEKQEDNVFEGEKKDFVCEISSSKIKKDTSYEILLILDYEENVENQLEDCIKVSTTKYLYNGKIYGYNPANFIKPTVGEGLKEVVEAGEILSCDVEKEAWLYKYNNCLYWIVSFSVLGELENNPEIPLFLYNLSDTCEVEKTYTGKYLREEDFAQHNASKYYVYMYELPEKEFLAMSTGVYHNRGTKKGWIWQVQIRGLN